MPEAAPKDNLFAALLAAGDAARAGNDAAAAERQYRAAIDVKPQEAEGWYALGLMLQELQDEAAVAVLRQAHHLDDSRSDIAAVLAQTLRTNGQSDEAIDLLRSVLEQRPTQANVMRELALCFAAQEKYADAVIWAKDSFLLSRPETDFVLTVALWCEAQGDYLQAIEVLSAENLRVTDDPRLPKTLAHLWHAVGDLPQAAQALQRYKNLCPQDDFQLPSGGDRNITHVQIRALFDSYAAFFDRHLQDKLNYKAPTLLRDAVLQASGKQPFACVIDVGCGTGLMGQAIKPQATTLIGIDLSPRMLRQAEAKKIYDALLEGDAATSLVRWVDSADLIVAADVLVYSGDLQPFLIAAHLALKSGGLLAFTVEANNGSGDFRLTDKRRYQHGESYLRRILTATGYDIRRFDAATLRQEKGKDVYGFVIVAGLKDAAHNP